MAKALFRHGWLLSAGLIQRTLVPGALQAAAGPQAVTLVRAISAAGSAGRLNHVAIAVPDLAAAAARWKDIMGVQVSQPQPLPEHGVTVVFVALPNSKLELLEPLGEGSPIAGFLQRNPSGGIHHICLEVDDVRSSMERLGGRVKLLSQEPKIGAHGTPVVFIHPRAMDGVLLELEEAKGGSAG